MTEARVMPAVVAKRSNSSRTGNSIQIGLRGWLVGTAM